MDINNRAADNSSGGPATRTIFNDAGGLIPAAAAQDVFGQTECALWCDYNESKLSPGRIGVSRLLGEAVGNDVEDSIERTIDILTQLGDLYEAHKHYIKAAACFHAAIPLHDKMDTYAWQRCFNLQDKVEAQAGVPIPRAEWNALIHDTWESLLADSANFTQRPEPEDRIPAQTNKRSPSIEPIKEPVFIAA